MMTAALAALVVVFIALVLVGARGPVQANEAVSRAVLPDAEQATVNSVLLEFFDQVHDLSGYQRPQGLHGFPPGPPVHKREFGFFESSKPRHWSSANIGRCRL